MRFRAFFSPAFSSFRKINVSLPSQRIDGFNLELANLTQSVRKSTMTLAPEAGSQRLRNVIKKNISKEQYDEKNAVEYLEMLKTIRKDK